MAVSPSSAYGDDAIPINRVKIFRRRMMTYTRCWFPSNWYLHPYHRSNRQVRTGYEKGHTHVCVCVCVCR